MKRAVKYCGGCNPYYDRVAWCRDLESHIGAVLPSARPEEYYDEIHVICGCSSRCADISALSAKRFIFYDSPEFKDLS